jgi:ABC-2 type transport system permease protein
MNSNWHFNLQRFAPLVQREWLQHRKAWALLAGVPLGLVFLLLVSGLGAIEFNGDTIQKMGAAFPAFVAVATMAGTNLFIFLDLWFSSIFISSGLARRDHNDRSVEFWLSVPVSHAQSLATPLLVHLILVPAAALVVGTVGGYAISMAAVTRVSGLAELAALPWGQLIVASFVVVLRLLAGLLLATMWLSPLILLTVLLNAWFRRWGWVILAVGFGLGGLLLERLLGLRWMWDVTAALLNNAATSFVSGTQTLHFENSADAFEALGSLPGLALHDLWASVGFLATPLFVGALLFAAACFWLLVQWRQRGASSGD